MNTEQRKFLINKIESTYKTQVEELKKGIPKKPELNNYLVASFLDNSAKILPQKTIFENLKKRVKSLGEDDRFIKQESSYNYSRRNRWDDDDDGTPAFYINGLPPHLIMEIPKDYEVEYGKYQAKKDEIYAKIKSLTEQKDSLVLRCTIGSNAIMDKLITQVDSLGDLDIFSEQLTLIAGGVINKPPQIGNGESKSKVKQIDNGKGAKK